MFTDNRCGINMCSIGNIYQTKMTSGKGKQLCVCGYIVSTTLRHSWCISIYLAFSRSLSPLMSKFVFNVNRFLQTDLTDIVMTRCFLYSTSFKSIIKLIILNATEG